MISEKAVEISDRKQVSFCWSVFLSGFVSCIIWYVDPCILLLF